jgi:hypothetical protein
MIDDHDTVEVQIDFSDQRRSRFVNTLREVLALLGVMYVIVCLLIGIAVTVWWGWAALRSLAYCLAAAFYVLQRLI